VTIGIDATTGAAVVVGDAGTVVSEDCAGGDNTRQGRLPSKCPFPWTTV